jgi:hypothetical protein
LLVSKALAQTNHVSPGLIADEVILRQAVDLPLDQISCHCPTSPSLGNHGAYAGTLAWKKNGFFYFWPIADRRRSLATPVKNEMVRFSQDRATEHGVELCAGFQPVQNLTREKTADQTARRLRPLARRALMTARPPRVRMRAKKPWVRARLTLEG